MSRLDARADPGGMRGDTTSAWQRHQAARTIAGHARDAADLAELLDMLGLTAAEGLEEPVEPAPEPPIKPAPQLDPGSACRIENLRRIRLIRQPAAPR